MKEFLRRRNNFKDNMNALYSVIWGQLSKPMRDKLVGLKHFKDFDNEKDTATLLIEIKAISYKYKGHRNPYLALDDAKLKLYSYYQKPHESNTLHYNTFHLIVEVVEHHGGTICRDEALIKIEAKKKDPYFDPLSALMAKQLAAKAIVRNKALAIVFLKQSDMITYSCLRDSLENQFSLGNYQYLTDLPSALTTLECYVKPVTTTTRCRLQDPDIGIDMTFVQAGAPVPGSDTILH